MTTTIFAGGAFSRVGAAAPSDTTPDAFTFVDQFNVPTATVRTSNSITVTGIDAAATISVTNGTYSINGAAFTGSAGTVVLGDTVRAQHTSSAVASTVVDTLIDIGGVQDTFSSTTAGVGGTASMAPVIDIFRRRALLL
jgi:hypothetical protein